MKKFSLNLISSSTTIRYILAQQLVTKAHDGAKTKITKASCLMLFILFLSFSEASAQGSYYSDIVSYYNNGTPANGMLITTNLPFSSQTQMPTIVIEGYVYGLKKTIGLIINYYIYTSGGVTSFTNYTVSSFGQYTPPIYLSALTVNGTTKVVIFIQDTHGYFPRFTVSAFAQGLSQDVAGNYTSPPPNAWTVTDAAIPVTLPLPSPTVSLSYTGGTVTMSGAGSNLDPVNAVPLVDLSYLANSGKVVVGWNRSGWAGETSFISNQGSGTGGGFGFYNHNNSGTEKELMYIMASGNVIIGNTNQTNSNYKLDVYGTERANSIVVNTTGADFVFDPSYRLKPLRYLEKYIENNHHLPEIPSAKQMQAEGLNLGDNQVKLLQKVEELTLYLIEKEKQLKAEEVKNTEQEGKLNAQQVQINLMKQQIEAIQKQLTK